MPRKATRVTYKYKKQRSGCISSLLQIIFVWPLKLIFLPLKLLAEGLANASERAGERERIRIRQKQLMRERDREKQKLAATNTVRQMQKLSPVEFEKYVGQVFTEKGYQVTETPRTGDGGVDLFLRKNGQSAVVQCKRIQGTVGEPVIRDLFGTMHKNRSSRAYIVTTGTVSNKVRQFCHGEPITIIDKENIVRWANGRSI